MVARVFIRSLAILTLFLGVVPSLATAQPRAEGSFLAPEEAAVHLAEAHRRAVARCREAANDVEWANEGIAGCPSFMMIEDRVRYVRPGPGGEGISSGQIAVSGDHLVTLYRGRLFVLSLAGGRMRLADSMPAYPPGSERTDDVVLARYDYVFVSEDWVIVVGERDFRGSGPNDVEINRFRLDRGGRLTFVDSQQFHAVDDYWITAYSVGLIDDRLVVYTRSVLGHEADLEALLPAIRRRRGEREGVFQPTIRASDVLISRGSREPSDRPDDQLHTIMHCGMVYSPLRCHTTTILGGSLRDWGATDRATYLWLEQGGEPLLAEAMIYRIPANNDPVRGLAVRGDPLDHFGDDDDAALTFVVAGEFEGPDGRLPRVGTLAVGASFASGELEARTEAYRLVPLPDPFALDSPYSLQLVRADADALLVGSEGRGYVRDQAVLAHVPLGGGTLRIMPLPIEAEDYNWLGEELVVADRSFSPEGLIFTTIDLQADPPVAGDPFVLPGDVGHFASQHPLFFQPAGPTGDGIVALRTWSDDDALPGWRPSITFLTRREGTLRLAGSVTTEGLLPPGEGYDDGPCFACRGWYDNAAPIFHDGRVFALLGHELIEVRIDQGEVHEIGRIDFTPRR